VKVGHSQFFHLFLWGYGGFLLLHVYKMGFGSWQVVAGLLGGMAVALVAHRKHGYTPSIFLVGHMTIEWYHHAQHGSHYDFTEILFCGVHAVLDVVFLTHEVREHYSKYAYLVLVSVGALVAGIFWYYYMPATPQPEVVSPLLQQALDVQKSMGEHNHSHGGGALGAIVVGGVLGCVLSQLSILPNWKHVHTH